MYVTLPQSSLKRALSLVAPLAGGKSHLAILKHVLVAASWGEICLRASNEVTSIQYRLPAEVQASGSVLLPAKVLAEFVSDLSPAPLTLIAPAPKDATKALLQCQQARAMFQLSGLACEEFPLVPGLGEEGMERLFLIDAELLKEVTRQVAFADSADVSRPALGGVKIVMDQGIATFAAADAFRVAMRSIAVPIQTRRELLIPAPALLELARLLPDTGAVQVAMQGSQILFHTDHMDVSTRLMHEAFPDFHRVIPASSETRVALPLASLSPALRLMAPFARADGSRLIVSIRTEGEEAGLHLQAVAADLGENEMLLPATISGPSQSFLVNLPWFAELLAAFPGNEVTLEVSGPRRPIVLRPLAAIQAISVIMPMFDNRAATPTSTTTTPEVAGSPAAS